MIDKNLINAAVQAAFGTPFVWGRSDCCLFVCDVVLAATGKDPMADLRGKYASEAEALALMPGGLVPLAMTLAAKMNYAAVSFPFTGADLGVVATENGPALGLFLDGKWLLRANNGVAVKPAAAGVMGWSI